MTRKSPSVPGKPVAAATLAQVAEVLGITSRSLCDWRKVAGWPGPRRAPFPLAPIIAWARQRWETEASASAPAAAGSLSDKARARRLDIMADLSALELAKRRGEMLPRGDVQATFYEFAGAVKTAAESFASTAPEAVKMFHKILEDQQRDLTLRYPEPVARKADKDERETA